MSKVKMILILAGIVLVGVVAIMFTDPGDDVYNQFLTLDDVNNGYNSKGKFNKEFEYHNEQAIKDKQEGLQDNKNNNGQVITGGDKGNYTWNCTYVDYSGNVVTLDGITYKAGDKGPAVPLMLQGGSTWSDYWPSGLAGGTNISASGCGYTSLAACLSYLTNKNITPQKLLEDGAGKFHTVDSGIGWGAFTNVPNWYGCSGVDIGHDINRLSEELKNGNLAVASVGAKDKTMNTFSEGGHIIAIRGITEDGNFLVNNPNGRGEAQLNVEWTPQQMQTLIKQEWIIKKN